MLCHIGLFCFAFFSAISVQAFDSDLSNRQVRILKNPEKIPALVKAGKIRLEQIPNPHWDKKGCITCHSKNPDEQGLYLRDQNYDRSCNNCHSLISDHLYIHPTGIQPSTRNIEQMDQEFLESVQRAKGQLSCITCHDLQKQCESLQKYVKQRNPMFLRAGPYNQHHTICFQCHNEQSFSKLNAHDQLTPEGETRIQRCGICHSTLDGLSDAMGSEDIDFNYKSDLSRMCTNCHPWIPHPTSGFSFGNEQKEGASHLEKLPSEMKKFYLKQLQNSAVQLPLEPGTEKVYCATCHNPHEKGVIKNAAAAAGADSEKRLRIKEICVQCHDK